MMKVQRRDARAVATGVQRQLEVPHRAEDRPVKVCQVEELVTFLTRIGLLIAGDYVDGHLGKVLDQPLRRRHQP
jgi:hypothetical protein